MPKRSEGLPEDWDPRDALKAQGIFDSLKRVAPSIAFRVEREHDEHASWDGDGTNPEQKGYVPNVVLVYACAIVNGELKETWDSLGGVYEKPGEEDEDVSGYLPQMIDDALDLLIAQLGKEPAANEARAAQAYIKEISRRLYDISMRYHEKRSRERREE